MYTAFVNMNNLKIILEIIFMLTLEINLECFYYRKLI